MALNFPANTSLPYVDPVSGLKYIYNTSVGAWEAAIQPPAIIASNPPAITIPGFLWWDDENGSLYIYYKDDNSEQWVAATTGGGSGGSGGGGRAKISTFAPSSDESFPGDLWWDSENGRLYIYYEDSDSKQWIQAQASSPSSAVSLSDVIEFYSSNTAPTDAASKEGDLWYNLADSTLYCYTSQEWKKSHNVTDPATFVSKVSAGIGITVSGSKQNPIVNVARSSDTKSGIVRLSNSTEAQEALNKNIALSPGALKDALAASPTSYLPSATAVVEGISSLATSAEVVAGTVNNKVISPQALNQALPTMGLNVPVGTVITFAGATVPSGYLECDGSLKSRTTYQALFQVIGTVYGIGDGSTTFKLPTVTGDFKSCIKF